MLKPYKEWDVYHRFQLVIQISLAHPQYVRDGHMHLGGRRAKPKVFTSFSWATCKELASSLGDPP